MDPWSSSQQQQQQQQSGGGENGEYENNQEATSNGHHQSHAATNPNLQELRNSMMAAMHDSANQHHHRRMLENMQLQQDLQQPRSVMTTSGEPMYVQYIDSATGAHNPHAMHIYHQENSAMNHLAQQQAMEQEGMRMEIQHGYPEVEHGARTHDEMQYMRHDGRHALAMKRAMHPDEAAAIEQEEKRRRIEAYQFQRVDPSEVHLHQQQQQQQHLTHQHHRRQHQYQHNPQSVDYRRRQLPEAFVAPRAALDAQRRPLPSPMPPPPPPPQALAKSMPLSQPKRAADRNEVIDLSSPPKAPAESAEAKSKQKVIPPDLVDIIMLGSSSDRAAAAKKGSTQPDANQNVKQPANPRGTVAPSATSGAVAAAATAAVAPTKSSPMAASRMAPTEQKGATPTSKKRKNVSKPNKRVLTGKKEKEVADKLLSNQTELVHVLPLADCHFLGKNMWVFTVSQLSWLLGIESNGTDGENNRRQELIDELLVHLARHDVYVKSSPNLHQPTRDVPGVGVPVVAVKTVSVAAPLAMTAPPPRPLATATVKATSATSPPPTAAAAAIRTKQAEVSSNAPVSAAVASAPIATTTMNGNVSKTIETKLADSHAPTAQPETKSPTTSASVASLPSAPAPTQKSHPKIEEWKKLINEYNTKAADRPPIQPRDQFRLDGPISALLPKYCRNFFASTRFTCLHDVLMVKKTETGRIVDMLMLWRQKCGIKRLPPLSLAKHLLGVSFRIENLFGSKEVVSRFTRAWTGGNLVCLSGAGREFIIHEQKMSDAMRFTTIQTKYLSDSLVLWREKRGMSTLKGTGKVAMISSWKAVVKDANDVENDEGAIILDYDFEKESEKEEMLQRGKDETEKKALKSEQSEKGPKSSSSSPPPPSSSSPSSAPPPKATEKKKAEPPATVATICGEDFTKELTHIGITTLEQLVDAKVKLPFALVRAIQRTQQHANQEIDNTSACTMLVEKWCEDATNALKSKTKAKSKSKSKPKSKPKEKAVASKPQEPKSSEASKKEPKPPKSPYGSLSTVARTFLASLGIQSAEEFLSTRTTDIANGFVSWREQMNMPILKGLGAIASVSGWKAQVRKAAKNAGMENVANMTPQSSRPPTDKKPAPKLAPLDRKDTITQFKKPPIKEKTDKRALFGMPRRSLAVASATRQFKFELSVRESSLDPDKSSIYLTYAGCTKKTVEGSNGEKLVRVNNTALPVLRDCPADAAARMDESLPFSSISPETGVIELRKHGVHHFPPKESIADVIDVLKMFIGDVNGVPGDQNDQMAPSSASPWNVFETCTVNGERHCLFFVKEPMEKGQTVELRFLPSTPSTLVSEDVDINIKERLWIKQRLSLLHLQELRRLLDHVEYTIGKPIYEAWQSIFKVAPDTGETSAIDDEGYIHRVVLARRRLHWVATWINDNLTKVLKAKNVPFENILPAVALSPLWKNEVVKTMVHHRLWNRGSGIKKLLHDEAMHEVRTEMSSKAFGAFFSSANVWCKLAKDLSQEMQQILCRYMIELNFYCNEEDLRLRICAQVSDAVEKVNKINPGTLSATDMEALSLTFRENEDHCSYLIPRGHQIRQKEVIGAYEEALALCSEPSYFEVPECDDGQYLAVTGTSKEDSTNTQAYIIPKNAFPKYEGSIFKAWYIERQVISVASSLVGCGFALLQQPFANSLVAVTRKKILETARAGQSRQKFKYLNVGARADHATKLAIVPGSIGSLNTNQQKYEPSSAQFFLGIVWPALKKLEWKVFAGNKISDVSFIPPDQKKDVNIRAKLMKQEAAKNRWRLARKTDGLGLEYVPKRTKRLIVCAATKLDIDNEEDQLKACTVQQVLQQFHSMLDGNIEEGDDIEDKRKELKKIIHLIAACFDEVAPQLFLDEEENLYEVSETQTPSEVYGCHYLMRLLLIMPSILQQMSVSGQQLRDVSGLVQELVDFLASNHESFFDQTMHIPHEDYAKEATVPPYVIPRLRELKRDENDRRTAIATTDGDVDDLSELVLPSDRTQITDYMAFVMDQVMVCRATQQDLAKKYRRISPGFPGLVCRHCRGMGGEGKLFFSTSESFATVSTSVDKHLGRCPQFSKELNGELAAKKSRHRDQSKHTPAGSQTAFFMRLWKRMHRSKASFGGNSSAPIDINLEPANAESARSDGGSSSENPAGSGIADVGFQDHVKLLEYLKTTAPWKDNADIKDAIDQYYNCIDYGGRILNTSAMPLHFNSEWLLSKIAPSRKRAR